MKGNPELETTRHMKNCINHPSQHPRVFLSPYETVFCEACNHYVTLKSNRISLQFNLPSRVFEDTTNLNS